MKERAGHQGGDLDGFLRALGSAAAGRRALGTLALWGLPCAAAWTAVSLLPVTAPPWVHLLLLLPLAAAAAAWLARPVQDLAMADRRLDLKDGLRTLAVPARDPSDAPFRHCLRRHVEQKLGGVRASRLVPRRGLRALRPWLCLLLLLLLLKLAFPLLPGSRGPAGLGGIGRPGGDAALQAGAGPGGEGLLDGVAAAPGPGQDPGRQEAPGETPEPPPGPPEHPQEEPPPSPPGLLPEPDQALEAFVAPLLDREGEEVERVAPLVRIPLGGPEPDPRGVTPRTQGVLPPEEAAEVLRAMEEALRRRRVPPAEERFVRGYFRRLAGRED